MEIQEEKQISKNRNLKGSRRRLTTTMIIMMTMMMMIIIIIICNGPDSFLSS